MNTAEQAWVELPEDDLQQLLLAMVGTDFGPEPQEHLDEIRRSREQYARRFITMAGVRSSDAVIDLGAGCGFGTRAIAAVAEKVWACDISPAYLKYARQECADLNNVIIQPVIKHMLHGIDEHSVDVIIGMSVFIHLNLYDIYWYFQEFRRIIRGPGRVCFDFADSDHLFSERLLRQRNDQKTSQAFIDHAEYYREDPGSLFSLMQWNSLSAIRQVASHHGFRLLRRRGSRVLFERRE
ncbi:MAG: hypothetical protein Tsb002_21450 [Wenzhouxiangellaceae bacterium]